MKTMTGELDGQVVIVTGGGNGIGRAMAREIARRGGKVTVADIDPSAASAVASEITADGGDAIAVTADVSDAAAADRMVEAAAGRYGHVDGLVNNAAIYATVAVTRAPYDEITEREWDDMMRVNVKGTWLCSRAAARAMRAQGTGGAIVNVSSGTVFKGTPGLIHYVTSKAAILGFTRSLARELGPHQIRVNAIAPGATASGAAPDTASGDGLDTASGVGPDAASFAGPDTAGPDAGGLAGPDTVSPAGPGTARAGADTVSHADDSGAVTFAGPETASLSLAGPDADPGEGWSPDRALPRREVPGDIVGGVVFLLSGMSAFVTGQTLVIDGGSYLH